MQKQALVCLNRSLIVADYRARALSVCTLPRSLIVADYRLKCRLLEELDRSMSAASTACQQLVKHVS
jgi:hypothetical protein